MLQLQLWVVLIPEATLYFCETALAWTQQSMLGIPHGLLPSQCLSLDWLHCFELSCLVPITLELINSFHCLFFFVVSTHTNILRLWSFTLLPTRTCWLSFSLVFSPSSALHWHCAVYQRAFHIGLGWLINWSKQAMLDGTHCKICRTCSCWLHNQTLMPSVLFLSFQEWLYDLVMPWALFTLMCCIMPHTHHFKRLHYPPPMGIMSFPRGVRLHTFIAMPCYSPAVHFTLKVVRLGDGGNFTPSQKVWQLQMFHFPPMWGKAQFEFWSFKRNGVFTFFLLRRC